MYLKDINLKATTHMNLCQGNPQTKCGFHLQFADSTYNLRISLTVADSATAHFNDTNVLSFACGFHKLFWIPQIQLRIPQIRLFWAILSGVADSATNLTLACCGFRLQCTVCLVMFFCFKFSKNCLKTLFLAYFFKSCLRSTHFGQNRGSSGLWGSSENPFGST